MTNKRISYKAISEKQTSIIQTLNYNYNSLKSDYEKLKEEITILKTKYEKYDLIIDILIKHNICDANILEDKIKIGQSDSDHEKIDINNDVNILNELDIKKNASKNVEIKKVRNVADQNKNKIESISLKRDDIKNIKNNSKNEITEKDDHNKKENIGNLEEVTYPKNNINIASNNKNGDGDISSDDKSSNNKVKISDSIVNRIKSFYYKNDYGFDVKYDMSFTNSIKSDINNNYDNIYKNKSEIIYNYYKLYKKYLEAKNNDNKLSFSKFVDYNNKDTNRYNEKVMICYKFFNNLIDIVKDVPEYGDYSKINKLIDIISKCRLSIDKLYKIRKDNYIELINFLSPIIIDECKNKYEQDKIIYSNL